mmetsp:Transcript_43355/g.63555  ORF Transcript_43355/g.63555 Transcript_43355/m.63555 type:complete len:136 (-) Transcript_43355:1438-1845(-)
MLSCNYGIHTAATFDCMKRTASLHHSFTKTYMCDRQATSLPVSPAIFDYTKRTTSLHHSFTTTYMCDRQPTSQPVSFLAFLKFIISAANDDIVSCTSSQWNLQVKGASASSGYLPHYQSGRRAGKSVTLLGHRRL